jgi:methylenetetrahydrofolate reductase (NADPH)
MKESRLSQLFQSRQKPLRSFEVFPPKTPQGIPVLLEHLGRLDHFSPDFISVTYGAGGSSQERSLKVLEKVHRNFASSVVAHFTCVGLDRDNIDRFISHLDTLGIKNILALRGDPPKNDPDFDFSNNCFRYSSELVAYLREHTDLCIGVAGYPEGHFQAPDRDTDWDRLKEKVDAGADFVITQLFFDNADFFRFRDALEKRGVDVPVVPGILPVPSATSLERAVTLSGARISSSFQVIVDRHAENQQDFRRASVAYFRSQVRELLESGVPGIHYYILNRSQMITEILTGLDGERKHDERRD